MTSGPASSTATTQTLASRETLVAAADAKTFPATGVMVSRKSTTPPPPQSYNVLSATNNLTSNSGVGIGVEQTKTKPKATVKPSLTAAQKSTDDDAQPKLIKVNIVNSKAAMGTILYGFIYIYISFSSSILSMIISSYICSTAMII